MADEFLIATNADPDPLTWTSVETLLASASTDITLRALGWEFEPYSKYITLSNGVIKGVGYPIIKWTFKGLRVEQRENLRDFCADLTSEVYIRTPTNETVAGVRVWKDYLCLMQWVNRSEILQDGIDFAEMVELTFTYCVVQ